MIYFTSDTHFGHGNIIKYCNRPFKNHWEMDEQMILNWNDLVSDDDEVYHLGDFGFGSPGYIINIMQQLKGKIYYIAGNHDKNVFKANKKIQRFEWIKDQFLLKVEDEEVSDGYQYLFLNHYPMLTWNHSHRGSWQLHGDYPVLKFNDLLTWHLYGHVHGGLSNKPNLKNSSANQMDVGVDCWEYEPISYDKVKEIITRQNLRK